MLLGSSLDGGSGWMRRRCGMVFKQTSKYKCVIGVCSTILIKKTNLTDNYQETAKPERLGRGYQK